MAESLSRSTTVVDPSIASASTANTGGHTNAATSGGVVGSSVGAGVLGGPGDAPIQKAIIKNVDMTEDMQRISIEIAIAALEKYTVEKDIAAEVKKEFDRKFNPTWHVVVGKNFGSYVTHGTFFLRDLAVFSVFSRNWPCPLGFGYRCL
jgi:dynein light chain LC8-type